MFGDYMESKVLGIGSIVSVPLYIGNSHNKPVYRHARIIQVIPKGHLGVMYLCETFPSHFRTCIVVPPPPRVQPDKAYDKDLQRWGKATRHNSLEVEPEPTPRKERTNPNEELCKNYGPFLEHIGLDPSRKRSIGQLRSLAHYRGFDYHRIERGIYEWL